MGGNAARTSPQTVARIGGALYLIIIFFGIFGELFVRGKLIVRGDATATAAGILASEVLWRVSVAAELFYLLCAVALAAIFYVLLRPVSNDLALLEGRGRSEMEGAGERKACSRCLLRRVHVRLRLTGWLGLVA